VHNSAAISKNFYGLFSTSTLLRCQIYYQKLQSKLILTVRMCRSRVSMPPFVQTQLVLRSPGTFF